MNASMDEKNSIDAVYSILFSRFMQPSAHLLPMLFSFMFFSVCDLWMTEDTQYVSGLAGRNSRM